MKMADEKTASTLVLVAAILQLITMIFWFFSVYTSFMGYLLLEMLFPGAGLMMLVFVIYYAIGGILGLIFLILWFRWRSAPGAHRNGLIVTGILALILSGFLGGLLALIAGFLAPKA